MTHSPPPLRILIAGGGTGGHVIPALAIARGLRDGLNAEVRFIGTPRGLETRLVPAAGFPLELIRVGQLKNVSLATRLRTFADLPLSVTYCIGLIRRFRPHAVIGVGGYASGPGMLAAILTRTPTLAFEPNAIPGMVNNFIGKYVSAAAVNFAPTTRFFRNSQVTGIPLREDFFRIPELQPGAPPHLFVFGGSQGSRLLNETMPPVLAPLLRQFPALTVMHQCGANHSDTTRAAFLASGADPSRWRVEPFLDDMPQRFAEASLILCRSGAATVAELAASGRPSLLVPFARAADDHQRKNAEVLVHAGAAAMLLESELIPERLLARLADLLGSPADLLRMGKAARALALPGALAQITALVQQIARKGVTR